MRMPYKISRILRGSRGGGEAARAGSPNHTAQRGSIRARGLVSPIQVGDGFIRILEVHNP